MSSVRVGRILGIISRYGGGGHPIILSGGQFLFKGELGYLLEEIFHVGRGKAAGHFDDEIQVDISGIHFGEVIIQNRGPLIFIQSRPPE